MALLRKVKSIRSQLPMSEVSTLPAQAVLESVKAVARAAVRDQAGYQLAAHLFLKCIESDGYDQSNSITQ